jgi:hypothetical protein
MVSVISSPPGSQYVVSTRNRLICSTEDRGVAAMFNAIVADGERHEEFPANLDPPLRGLQDFVTASPQWLLRSSRRTTKSVKRCNG